MLLDPFGYQILSVLSVLSSKFSKTLDSIDYKQINCTPYTHNMFSFSLENLKIMVLAKTTFFFFNFFFQLLPKP